MREDESTTQTRRPSRAALISTRVLAGILAALVLLQGALAGAHLTGQGGALDLHRDMGTVVLSLLGLITAVVSAVAFRRNRWAFPVATLAFFGLWAQIELGFLDRLGIHLPLGIALFGTYLILAVCPRDRLTTTAKEQ